MGIAGQINLAQVAFFGVGAYADGDPDHPAPGSASGPRRCSPCSPPPPIGLLVGTPALRMQSHYLGIVTLGLALAFTNWVTNAQIAGGAEGISGIPGPTLPGIDLSSEYLFYYLELIVFAVALGVRPVRRAHPARPPDAGHARRLARRRRGRRRGARCCG